jgi:hypothetical protein
MEHLSVHSLTIAAPNLNKIAYIGYAEWLHAAVFFDLLIGKPRSRPIRPLQVDKSIDLTRGKTVRIPHF